MLRRKEEDICCAGSLSYSHTSRRQQVQFHYRFRKMDKVHKSSHPKHTFASKNKLLMLLCIFINCVRTISCLIFTGGSFTKCRAAESLSKHSHPSSKDVKINAPFPSISVDDDALN
jgi:hypothetical protein